jgi:electron transfer flavoprotein alpha subunit
VNAGPDTSPGTVVAVTAPAREGVVDAGAALIDRATRLAETLGTEVAALTWDLADEADVECLSRAAAGVLRDRGAVIALLADDDLGRQLAPVMALELGTAAVVGCAEVVVSDAGVVFVKPVQGGWLERELSFAAGCAQVATIQLDVAPAASGEPPTDLGPAVPQWIATTSPAPDGAGLRVRRLDLEPPDPRTVDLVHARRIVGVGVGGAGDDLLDAVAELAELLEGSVGATRPVVDDGRLPKERLIGQTGRTVAPELYLALGISGSPHHVAGVQGAEHIVTVNKDEHAPIVSFSDTSFVGRLEDVLPALVRQLRALRAGDGPTGAGGATAEDAGA